MRAVGLVVGWLVLSVLAAAFIAPWLYAAAQYLAVQFPSIHGVADFKFHRYFNRLVMVFALVGVVVLGRRLGYRSAGSLGLTGAHRMGRLGLGFAMSAIFIGALALSIYGAGQSVADSRAGTAFVLKACGSAVLTGLVVGLIEEIFFRGFLYDVVRKEWKPVPAMILVSLFYSILHFVKSPGGYTVGPVHWDTMFNLLPLYISGMQHIDGVVFGGLNLFVAGFILAWAYQKTGNLYLSIGMHAGWVFALKLNGKLTDWAPGYQEAWLGWGGDLRIGPLALVVLLLEWWLLCKLCRQLIILGP